MSQTLRSPLPWLGSKGRLAQTVLSAFPHPEQYKVFCEVFAGSCSVLFTRPRSTHLEVINDRNQELVNFWMRVRDDAEYLIWKLKTLPYAHEVFKQYRESLREGTILDEIERAARWYYVKRGTITGHINPNKPWGYTSARAKVVHGINSEAVAYQHAVALLEAISVRLKAVQIHTEDFEAIITKYDHPQTLFYVDPPYMGTEHYYTIDETPRFTETDHERLAQCLARVQGMVVLSHEEHPRLRDLYPEDQWRRIPISVARQTGNFNHKQIQVTELLLTNVRAARQATLF